MRTPLLQQHLRLPRHLPHPLHRLLMFPNLAPSEKPNIPNASPLSAMYRACPCVATSTVKVTSATPAVWSSKLGLMGPLNSASEDHPLPRRTFPFPGVPRRSALTRGADRPRNNVPSSAGLNLTCLSVWLPLPWRLSGLLPKPRPPKRETLLKRRCAIQVRWITLTTVWPCPPNSPTPQTPWPVVHATWMSRWGLLKPINHLARYTTKWTTSCDQRLEQLMSYIDSAIDVVRVGWVGDAIPDLRPHHFSDADFAGCTLTLKATSGAYQTLTIPLRPVAKPKVANPCSPQTLKYLRPPMPSRATGSHPSCCGVAVYYEIANTLFSMSTAKP